MKKGLCMMVAAILLQGGTPALAVADQELQEQVAALQKRITELEEQQSEQNFRQRNGELIRQLDIETPATPGLLDFKVFRLKNMSAVDGAQKLRAYFYTSDAPNEVVQPEIWIASLHGPVAIITDYRSNAIIVKGNSEVIRRAERFLAEVDTDELETKNIVRIFNFTGSSHGQFHVHVFTGQERRNHHQSQNHHE